MGRSLCVFCTWMARESILFSASLDCVGCLEKFLCINCLLVVFAPKMDKEMCPREHTRICVDQLCLRMMVWVNEIRRETSAREGSRHRQAVKTMTTVSQHFWKLLRVSKGICDSQTHTHRHPKRCHGPCLLMFTVLYPLICPFFFLPSCLFLLFFVRLMKCSLSSVWNLTKSSSLDDRTANQMCGLFYSCLSSGIHETIIDHWSQRTCHVRLTIPKDMNNNYEEKKMSPLFQWNKLNIRHDWVARKTSVLYVFSSPCEQRLEAVDFWLLFVPTLHAMLQFRNTLKRNVRQPSFPN